MLLLCAAVPSLTLNSASTRRCAPPRCTAASDESALLDLLASDSNRGKALGAEQVAEVHRLAASLEAAFDTPGPDGGMPDTNYDPLLAGRWRVLYQGKPNTDTPFFSLESWQAYLSGDGPSPIQNLVSGSGSVGRLYQIVELELDGDDGRILNVVDASPTAVVAIDAALEGRLQPRRPLGVGDPSEGASHLCLAQRPIAQRRVVVGRVARGDVREGAVPQGDDVSHVLSPSGRIEQRLVIRGLAWV